MKIGKIFLILMVLVICSQACFVLAADNYHYYFEDPVVPQQENLEVKNNLLADLFSGAVA